MTRNDAREDGSLVSGKQNNSRIKVFFFLTLSTTLFVEFNALPLPLASSNRVSWATVPNGVPYSNDAFMASSPITNPPIHPTRVRR